MTLSNCSGYPYQCDNPTAATNDKQSNSQSSSTGSTMFAVTQPALTARGGGGSVVVVGQSISCGVGGDGGGDDDDGDKDDCDYDYDDEVRYDDDHLLYKQGWEWSSIAHHSHRFIDHCKVSSKAMMLKLFSTSSSSSTSNMRKNISGEILPLVAHHIPAGGGSWDGGSDYYSTGYPSKSRHASPRGDPRAYRSDGYDDRGYPDGRATKLFPFLEFTSIIPKLFKVSLASMVLLYALNQSHILPRYSPKLSAWTSRVLFWPTLPITAGRRIGEWYTVIDDTVVLGGAPFAIFDLPKKLQQDHGIEAVINFCQEYRGPLKDYENLGIKELYLPTIDHFEPSATDLYDALTFLQECQRNDKTVYVHCRAGHGRSGACTLSWLMLQEMIKNNDDQSMGKSWIDFYHDYRRAQLQPEIENPKDAYKMWKLNRELGSIRKVRSSLWKQPNIWRVNNAIQRYASDYRNLPARQENSDLDKFLRTADVKPSSSPSKSSEL